MIAEGVSYCPYCGGRLIHYDTVSRILRTKRGTNTRVKLRRLQCKVCSRVHREIPEYISPYKRYEAEVISGVTEGLITCNTIGFEDYPCALTMARWIREKYNHYYERRDDAYEGIYS